MTDVEQEPIRADRPSGDYLNQSFQESITKPTKYQTVNNTKNFIPMSDYQQSLYDTSANASQVGFMSFRSQKKEYEIMKETQIIKNDAQRLLKLQKFIAPFPQNNKQVQEYYANYKAIKYLIKQPTLEDFDKDVLKNNSSFTIRQTKNSIYYGQIVNENKQGKGLLIHRNGRIYEGDWENDHRHGKGFEIFQNGSHYRGNYVNGKLDGVGLFEWRNGEVYEGQWLDGTKHGSGIWKGSKGDSYIGQWKQGNADGFGVHIWVNGDRYEGQFSNCLKTGQGQEKFANGDTYMGIYENGKPGGFGEYFWSNGSVYKGEFKNGLRHGKGIWSRGTGISERYEGQFEFDKKNGEGIFTWPDGNRYEGSYKNDLRAGQGTMYWNDGSFYKGLWDNGIQDGEGEMCLNGQRSIQGIYKGTKLIKLLRQDDIQDGQLQKQYNLTISDTNKDNQDSIHVSIDNAGIKNQQDIHQKIDSEQGVQMKHKPLLLPKQKVFKDQNNILSPQELQSQQLTSQLGELITQCRNLQLQQQEMQKKQDHIVQVNPSNQARQSSTDFYTINPLNNPQSDSNVENNKNEWQQTGLSHIKKRRPSLHKDKSILMQNQDQMTYMDNFTQTQQFEYRHKEIDKSDSSIVIKGIPPKNLPRSTQSRNISPLNASIQKQYKPTRYLIQDTRQLLQDGILYPMIKGTFKNNQSSRKLNIKVNGLNKTQRIRQQGYQYLIQNQFKSDSKQNGPIEMTQRSFQGQISPLSKSPRQDQSQKQQKKYWVPSGVVTLKQSTEKRLGKY